MKIRRNGKIVDLKECPYCGYDEVYNNWTASGQGTFAHHLNGGIADNGEMYSMINAKNQKTLYCVNCHKKIGFLIDK